MKIFVRVLACAVVIFFTVIAGGQAADCLGPWKTIPNYKNRMGSPCRHVGLDTHNGVCLPGEEYETLCDDTSEGRYRTCKGPRRCFNNGAPQGDCRYWDNNNNQPCPPGYINEDCKGYCEQDRKRDDNCRYWDYVYNRPCPDGYVNHDCRGGCEPDSSWRK